MGRAETGSKGMRGRLRAGSRRAGLGGKVGKADFGIMRPGPPI
jgi:hypothetical protein